MSLCSAPRPEWSGRSWPRWDLGTALSASSRPGIVFNESPDLPLAEVAQETLVLADCLGGQCELSTRSPWFLTGLCSWHSRL